MMRSPGLVGVFLFTLEAAACGGLTLSDVPDASGVDDGGSSGDASTNDESNGTTPRPSDAGPDGYASDAVVDAARDAMTDAIVDAAMDARVDPGDASDAGVETVVSVSTNNRQTCFATSAGRLFCDGPDTPAAAVSGVTDAVEVAVGGGSGSVFSGIFWGGGYFRCFRRAGGTVECAGANDLGQLGDGTMDYGAGTKTSRLTFAPVVGLTDAVQISIGAGNHACARRATGDVVCWGGNWAGALGDGTRVYARPTPAPVVGLTDAIDVSVGLFGACAVRAGGQVVCWGAADVGETGTSVPVAVAGMNDAVAVAKGPYFAHAIRADGSVWGWGRRGPWLGDGVSTTLCTSGAACLAPPAPVVGLAAATKITAGGHQSVSAYAGACALRPSGVVSCWGGGALGDDKTSVSAVPVDVIGIADAVGVSRGQMRGCAIRPLGRISCWGGAPVDLPW